MKTFISWNINGIRAGYRKGFLDWFNKVSPDILALQETKAHPDQLPPDLTILPNYFSYFSSAERKGYSGVAVYSKIKPDSVDNSFSDSNKDKEGRILILTFKNFKFINLYYPNGKGGPDRLKYKLEFYGEFLEYVRKNNKYNLIVCGDVNTAHTEIDLAHPKENENVSGFLKVEREWLDRFIKDGNLIDTFRKFNSNPGNYTWWDMKSHARDRDVGWRIDYFYVSESLKGRLKNARILKTVMGSDHCPISIDVDI